MGEPLTDIPVAYLRECFGYDPAAGTFIWRDRPGHFTTYKAYKAWADRCRGRPAFTKRAARGYRCTSLTYDGRLYYLMAHRVAWAIVTGAWPAEEIDHIDRNTENNRFSNLREAGRSLNGFNRNFRPNATGLTGVQLHGQRYSAKIRGSKGKLYLGTFDTPEEAHRIYKAAAMLFFDIA